MLKKVGIILGNFIKSSTKNEKMWIFLFPFVGTILIYLFFNCRVTDFKLFADDFNETVINVTALLASFGLAALSILISSSSDNIERAKETYTKRKDIMNKEMSYYKLQVVRNFFALFIQILVLSMSLIYKFITEVILNIEVYFYIELFWLMIAIMAQIFVIISMYYLFVGKK
ncbi:hypothetical protein [Clostridium paraputrificum]|uniref:hypothetical protein n=1 Tax=Clostridium paraputrificum TaxID=29363 RepID=UPI00374E654C